MKKLTNYFERIGFSGTDLDKIINSFELRSFKKNDFVVEEGKVSRHIGFVESGMFQYYVIKDGEERTTYVSIENTFFASVLSFISKAPALENIRALTDGSISLISRENLKKLVDEIPGFKDFYINLLEHTICGIDASRHDLIVLTAEQRYEKMLREEPHLLQHIPLQHLASILGVTPRHLSRIRGSIR
ncbi:cyclic nucleotide-binding domain-containing protein [Spirosoma sp. HMF4905]|uniref:Cyclic nucleotide-binding domain-containing protein n=1 Tax=Spirosoma arboris TaxID=2682092 RepID=A0A7K1S8M1_9BACT|nr:Crp/Fnr family transcriptional regulator [Spirosoma arboris]MVM30163.1 cyclic nucleotide-binding domain-containing protein [Spirosoma arboris]